MPQGSTAFPPTGTTTMTSTVLGALRTDARPRSEFRALTGLPG
ncbi:hypothetical protein J2S55_008738 [Streptosporangium brasiliense]|uniref:Uncharacterized protein n=1 Tax=Streptosporangium brasiliense TaxID=47480 RepID=A0ABT9RJJ5_9ACTN|nr:hypothetical protein [Streptosporangium brasiliense]